LTGEQKICIVAPHLLLVTLFSAYDQNMRGGR